MCVLDLAKLRDSEVDAFLFPKTIFSFIGGLDNEGLGASAFFVGVL